MEKPKLGFITHTGALTMEGSEIAKNNGEEIPLHLWVPPNRIARSSILGARWEPFLGAFLMSASDHVSHNAEFYSEQVGDFGDKGTSPFLNFFLSRERRHPARSAFVLKGQVGIGKTSFLNWWQQRDDRRTFSSRIDINHDGMRYTAGGPESITDFMQKRMAIDLLQKLSLNGEFNKNFKEKVKRVQIAARAQDDTTFEVGFVNQSAKFLETYPSVGPKIFLSCVIVSANEVFNRPIWLLVDNVDLEAPDIQALFIRGAYSTYHDLCDYTLNQGWDALFHLVLTVRPETWHSWRFYTNDFQDIDYPEPDVLHIAKRRVFEALIKAASETKLDFSINIGDDTFPNSRAFAIYIIKIISGCVKEPSWPFHPNPKLWHIHLVNGNIRRFVKAWVHFVLSGNFLNLWAFSDFEEFRQPSPYVYLRMLIRGPFTECLGNSAIDASGENPDSPLVFNLFGAPCPPGTSIDQYIKNYFIYIRILQYITGQEREVSLPRITDDLSAFFDSNAITDAIRMLIWARLLDEVNIGARNIGSKGSWGDIELVKTALIKSSDTTLFYLNSLLPEFEYFSAMAMISYQLRNDENSNFGSRMKRKTRIARATLALLYSCFEILKYNMDDYYADGKIDKFKALFISPKHSGRPFMNMIRGSIRTVNKQAGLDEAERERIIKKLQYLHDETRKYIIERLGKIYG